MHKINNVSEDVSVIHRTRCWQLTRCMRLEIRSGMDEAHLEIIHFHLKCTYELCTNKWSTFNIISGEGSLSKEKCWWWWINENKHQMHLHWLDYVYPPDSDRKHEIFIRLGIFISKREMQHTLKCIFIQKHWCLVREVFKYLEELQICTAFCNSAVEVISLINYRFLSKSPIILFKFPSHSRPSEPEVNTNKYEDHFW